MQRIRIIDANTSQQFDVPQNQEIQTTIQQSEIVNPTSVRTSRTTSFLLADTAKNHNLLDNINIVGSTSPKKNKYIDVILKINDIDVISNGNMIVLSYEKKVGYRVVVVDRVFGFFERLNEKTLRDLESFNENFSFGITTTNNTNKAFIASVNHVLPFRSEPFASPTIQVQQISYFFQSFGFVEFPIIDFINPSYSCQEIFNSIIEENDAELIPLSTEDNNFFQNISLYPNQSNITEELEEEENFNNRYNVTRQQFNSITRRVNSDNFIFDIPFDFSLQNSQVPTFSIVSGQNRYTAPRDMYLNVQVEIPVRIDFVVIPTVDITLQALVSFGGDTVITDLQTLNFNNSNREQVFSFNPVDSFTFNSNIKSLYDNIISLTDDNNLFLNNTFITFRLFVPTRPFDFDIIVAENDDSLPTLTYTNSYSSRRQNTINLKNNLPEISQKKFFSDMLAILRKNIQITNNVVKLYNFDEVINNEPYDWSDKIDYNTALNINFQTSLAKNNNIKFTEKYYSDTEPLNINRFILISNSNQIINNNPFTSFNLEINNGTINYTYDRDDLENSKDVYTLDSILPNSFITSSGNTLTILSLTREQSFDDLRPRKRNNTKPIYFVKGNLINRDYLKINNNFASFTNYINTDGTLFFGKTQNNLSRTFTTQPIYSSVPLTPEIIQPRYEAYQNVLDKGQVLNLQVKLSLLDINNIDLSRPVYLEQYQNLFLINKIIFTDENKLSQVELVLL